MTAVADDVASRREALLRRLTEVVRERSFLGGEPIPIDFVVPLELLGEIGTSDAELVGLYWSLWEAAGEASWQMRRQGDETGADQRLRLDEGYARLASLYYERAKRHNS
jgi:hypothetical protein